MKLDTDSMHGTLSWVLVADSDPDWAVADFLARDIDPHCGGAVDLVTSGIATLEQLRRAKEVFKTLRMEGETSRDRRVGAVLYAATIGQAFLRFGERITRQRDQPLIRALSRLALDQKMPAALRELGRYAGERMLKSPQVWGVPRAGPASERPGQTEEPEAPAPEE